MKFDESMLEKYLKEINYLNEKYLGEKIDQVTYFGIVENDELQAISTVKCFYGHWQLRTCVVKPEHRGKGLQKQLINERLEYLKDKTNVVKVSVEPHNEYSLNNIKAEGFEFWKKEKLKNGKLVHKYKKNL